MLFCSIRIRILVGQEHVSELLWGVWMHQEGAEMAFYSLFCLYFKRFLMTKNIVLFFGF